MSFFDGTERECWLVVMAFIVIILLAMFNCVGDARI